MGKRCLWTLFAISVAICFVALAQAETKIEVDENGDEYELKRFYIQGRQLSGSGSKSQCVVTRRKRASRSMSLPAVPAEHRETVVMDLEQNPSGNRRYVALTALQLDGDDDDHEEDEADDDEEGLEEQMDEQNEDETEAVPQPQQQQKQLQGQTSLVAATFALPQSLPQGVSVVANKATHANIIGGGDAGIVVVESEQPPKVNPSTHAVFELKPLNPQQQHQQQQPQFDFQFWPQNYEGDEDDEDEDEEEEDGDEFVYQQVGFFDEQEHVITEDSPLSTTAIWSTDDSDIHPVINEANKPTDVDKKKKKMKRRKPGQEPIKRKTQKKKQQKRPSQQDLEEEQQVVVKRKPQTATDKRKKPSSVSSASSSSSSIVGASSSSLSTSNKRKRPSSSSSSQGVSNKRKTNPAKRQKQKKTKRKSRPSQGVSNNNNNNKRRRPSNTNSRPIGGYNRRRPVQSQSQSQAQKRRRQQQKEKRRRQELQRRRRRRNRNRNRLNNMNRQDYFGNEPIINCIYINKDPPTTTTTTTTTARPFWNILGRDATATEKLQDTVHPPIEESPSQVRRSGDFGHRKRTNLRFVA